MNTIGACNLYLPSMENFSLGFWDKIRMDLL